jgi:hypothetical protein
MIIEKNLLIVKVECFLAIIFSHKFERIYYNQTVPQESVYFFVLKPPLDLIQNLGSVYYVHLYQILLD